MKVCIEDFDGGLRWDTLNWTEQPGNRDHARQQFSTH
jgi:hypothetical protein